MDGAFALPPPPCGPDTYESNRLVHVKSQTVAV